MATATELMVAEQLEHVRQIAQLVEGWSFEQVDAVKFIIGLLARDQSWFWLFVDCELFTQQPPAFHWYNPQTKALDLPPDTPRGGSYFHGSGRICAPWNRLAYKECDPIGPHGDWQLSSWMTHEKTGGTITLAAMVLRIHFELQSPLYQGRM
jgi:hypothetical protein